MSRKRFVLDTNVIISAVLSPRSVSRQAFDLAFRQGTVLVSEAVLNELDNVLHRPKFERFITADERSGFFAKFVQDATVIAVVNVITDCRDPKDNKFLELAVSGAAHSIISGDADLLVLHPFRGVSILTPRAFVSSM